MLYIYSGVGLKPRTFMVCNPKQINRAMTSMMDPLSNDSLITLADFVNL